MRWTVAMVVLLGMGGVATSADVVRLHNGDVLSGHFESLREGTVTLTTDYAGTISIRQDAVLSIKTEAAMTVRLRDGVEMEATLQPKDDGQWLVFSSGDLCADFTAIESIERAPETPETVPEPPRPKRWGATVDATLSMRQGNTDTMDTSFGVEVVRKGDRHVSTLALSGGYGEADGYINTRRYKGVAKHQFYPIDKLYLFAAGGAERDYGRKLDVRAHGSGGVGYDFLQRDSLKFSADIGLDYTWDRWMPYTPRGKDEEKSKRRSQAGLRLSQQIAALSATPPGNLVQALEGIADTLYVIRDPLRGSASREEDSISLHLGAYYEQTLFWKSSLTERLTLLPSLDDFGEFRAISELGFNTPLMEHLKLRISLKTEYDSMARRSGVESWDNLLQAGLRYEFGVSRTK